jgi:hypothetical protein
LRGFARRSSWRIDATHSVGDFLDADDLHTLPFFGDPHEIRRVEQRIVGSRIEPSGAAAELLQEVDDPDARVEPRNVVALGIADVVAEDGRA